MMDINQDPVARVRVELMTREIMISVLGLIGVWAGIAIMLTGAPDFIEAWFSPWSRYLVGGWATLVGSAVVTGVVLSDRRPCGYWLQVWGLLGMTVWYLALGTAYVVVVTSAGLYFVGPGEPLRPEVSGRGYVPLVYLGLVMMTTVPLCAMWRLGRPGRRLGT